MQLNITGGFYESDSLPVSAQRLVNAYVNVPQTTGAYSNEVIFGTPGISQLATTGTISQINRGAWVMAGIPYFVNGTSLQSVDVDGNLSLLGTITGTGRVSMADNGTQLCILVPGGSGFIWNEGTTTFATITDADFTANGNPQHVRFNDGFFVFSTDTKQFIISALNNGLAYDALDVGTAEADPDVIVAPWTFNGRVYMLGSETIEPFRNIGGAQFPYQRIDGGILSAGLFSPFSLVDGDKHFYWIGGGKNEKASIWRSNGNTPEKISTTAVDSLIQGVTDDELEDIFSWSYSEEGAFFIGFHLPDTTIIYDEINGRWHERTSEVLVRGETTTIGWRVASMVTAFGDVLVGDTIDGRIGTLNTDLFTEYDDDRIKRRIITQPFGNQNDTFFMPSLELTMESGVGNAAEPDPQVRLSISRDGGSIYSPERTRGVGKTGERKRRQIWNKNGRISRTDVLQWEFSAPCKFVAIRADARLKAGVQRYAA